MRSTLRNYLRAGFPLVYLTSWEEVRVESDLKSVCAELGFSLHSWSVTEGLLDVATGAARDVQDPIEILSAVLEMPEKTVVLLRDYHAFLGDDAQPVNPLIARTIRDLSRVMKTRQQCLVICAPILRLPQELEREVVVIEHELPGRPDLGAVLDGIAESAGLPAALDEERDRLLDACLGMTTSEAENALALSFVETGGLDPQVVARQKAEAVRKGQLLELHENPGSLDEVGGLDLLKGWLLQRRDAFSRRARDYGLPTPKGLLMVGLPGCGKSLTAKATAAAWERPLLRLDCGRLFGGLVGESERNLRRVIQVAEAVSPCVLWVDEIEKGLSGSQSSSSTDGGTSARVLGSMLSWMEEKTASVFVIATANDVSALPPELLRKGRFDETFFVDLPGEEERAAILAIHLKKRDRDPAAFDLKALAKASEQFSGAELEAAVVAGMFAAFEAGQQLESSHVGEAIQATVPLARTARERIQGLRDWAKSRARPASGEC
ncbi:MAG: AAA family ATPase [Planctomycetes bacterium]|nr:AAA family ATPase [Planctomycetota bacterium]